MSAHEHDVVDAAKLEYVVQIVDRSVLVFMSVKLCQDNGLLRSVGHRRRGE